MLRGELEVTLYRSAGAEVPGEATPRFLRPLRLLARTLPLRPFVARDEYRDYKLDCLAFAWALALDLRQRRFDVVHVIDPPLVRVLQRLRRALRLPGRMVFTEGCLMPPSYYPRVDHIHHVGQQAYLEAQEAGVSASHMTLLPCGLHAGRFAPCVDGARLRREHGIPDGTFVVLVVSAIKRAHKRVDHVIEEVSRLRGDVLLWLDGREEDPAVTALARSRLGERCRISHVPSGEVAGLYGVADVLVHGALAESFGLSVVEALCCGTPVLAHRSPHFEWLVEDPACLLDMTRAGALGERLQELRAGRDDLRARAVERASRTRRRFDWDVLRPRYVEMYERVAAAPLALGSGR